MFCIAAFIVFGVLAVFSASYRPLAKKAWHCVVRRITFRPCDISFGDEVKGKLIGTLIFTHPRLARFVSKWIDWLSFAFVALSIWSLAYVLNAGLNLWVYDTCTPKQAESCSLSGEACGIEQVQLGFVQALGEGRFTEWAGGPFVRFAETLSRIPDRLRTWNAKEYLSPTATFLQKEDTAKPYALEVIDPGCKFCRKLTKNVRDSGVDQLVNFSYLLYPIPTASGGYKFANSKLRAQYIEATKQVPLNRDKQTMSADWQLLEKLFAEPTESSDVQARFNIGMTTDEAERALQSMLRDIGYSANDVVRIAKLAHSKEVFESLAEQRAIVEMKIRTIKIPTLLLGGRRFDRVIDAAALKRAVQ